MTEDISKKTILVLVVLTIIVSALGTLTVMDSVSRAQFDTVPVQNGQDSASGFVHLNIGDGTEDTSAVTGRVILDVVKTS